MKQPTPREVKKMREEAGLTRNQAAELVHAVDQGGAGSYRTWQNWELDPESDEARAIPLASWELFLRKIRPTLKDPATAAAVDRLLRT